MTNKKDLQQLNIRGIITATSNKQSTDFITENPRKTAYLKVDDTNKKILIDNGMTEYTSKRDKESFFIVKLSETLDIWNNGEETILDSNINTPNFETIKEVDIAIIKGYNKGNHFFRIFALGVEDNSTIDVIEKTNPFDDFVEVSNDDIPF